MGGMSMALSPLDRLTAEDERILKLERGPIAGHVCNVIIVEAPRGGARPTLAGLQGHVAGRLARVPRCGQRLAPTPLGVAPPLWVDDVDFDVIDHVGELAGGREIADDAVQGEVARLMEGRLDRRHPLWSLHMARLSGGRTALLWREHHCMADGMTGLRMLSGLLWDTEPDPTPVEAPSHLIRPGYTERDLFRLGLAARFHPPGRRSAPGRPGGWRDAWARARGTAAVLRREVLQPSGRSPLAARVGPRRSTGWNAAPLEALHQAGKAVGDGVTLNDVVLAVVAGGLRSWLSARQAEAGHLRVKVPVSLHGKGEAADQLGNRDCFVFADLHVEEPDLCRRLTAISLEMSERKVAGDAERLDTLIGELRHRPLGRHAVELTMSHHVFALNVSNVPGPPGPLYVMGGRVAQVHGVSEIAEGHALRVAARSAVGLLSFGLCADSAVVPDLGRIIEGMQLSIDELLALRGR